jgi:hypothetical protein
MADFGVSYLEFYDSITRKLIPPPSYIQTVTRFEPENPITIKIQNAGKSVD